jgi:hypothetical protein
MLFVVAEFLFAIIQKYIELHIMNFKVCHQILSILQIANIFSYFMNLLD